MIATKVGEYAQEEDSFETLPALVTTGNAHATAQSIEQENSPKCVVAQAEGLSENLFVSPALNSAWLGRISVKILVRG